MEKIATREAYGKALVELGKKNKNIVVVSADLEDATKIIPFRDEFPERFFTFGIAEQNMIGAAAGLSKEGYIVFANSFAGFMTNRAYDQIRMCICYNDINVKLVGSHAGITVGPDGGSAQCLEDFAIMRVLPNMTVVCPCDALETYKATAAIADFEGPVYMRTSRPPMELITSEEDTFIIGRANTLRQGSDVTIIGAGIILLEALSAAEKLAAKGISCRVVNMHTLKPIDEKALIAAARETGAIVTVEEHQVNGGLGSAVSEVLSKKIPAPIEMVAIDNRFGESGTADELLVKYNLKDNDIIKAVEAVIVRKR